MWCVKIILIHKIIDFEGMFYHYGIVVITNRKIVYCVEIVGVHNTGRLF